MAFAPENLDRCAGVVCTPLDQCHDAGVCDPGTGVCSNPVKANGTSCDDGSACTTSDACSGGSCVGEAVNCDDGDACTVDACSSGACTHTAACSIGGTIRYYRDVSSASEPSTKGTPGIGIDVTNDFLADATTDAPGTYLFPGVAGESWVRALDRLYVTWPDEARTAVSSFDASQIARYAVGKITFSPNQLVAGDASGNGSVSSFDAAMVAQFAVELIQHLPVAVSSGSDWKLLRCDHYTSATSQDCGEAVFHHPVLAGPVTDDFYSVLYGDVTGDYPAGGLLTQQSNEETLARANDRSDARTYSMAGALPKVRATTGPAVLSATLLPAVPGSTTRQVAVTLGNSDGILGLDLELRYQPELLSVRMVRAAGIASGFQAAHVDRDGTLRIALYGPVPLEGSGTILVIDVDVNAPPPSPAVFAISASANEGSIPVTTAPPVGGGSAARNGRGAARRTTD